MKNLKNFLALSLLMTGILLLSIGSANAQTMSREDAKQKIVNAIDYPKAASEQNLQGDVLVSVGPDESGKLTVTGVNSSEPELSRYVVERITALQFGDEPVCCDEPIMLRFVFRII